MSSRSQKSHALRALSEQRRKKQKGVSVLDNYEIKDEGDVYEHVDEEDYRNLVDKRREREDFVVDDDGLGYHDDGEEVVFDQDDHDYSKGRRKRSGKNAELSENELRKLRRTNAKRKETEKETEKTGSMWGFVTKGANVAVKKNEKEVSEKEVQQTNHDFSSLMEDYDEVEDTFRKRRDKRRGDLKSSRVRSRSLVSPKGSGRNGLSSRSRSNRTPRQYGSAAKRTSSSHRSREYSSKSYDQDLPDDDFHDFQDERATSFEMETETQPQVNLNEEMLEAEKDSPPIPSSPPSKPESSQKPDERISVPTTIPPKPTAVSKRKRLAFKPKSSKQLSGPALAALEKQKQNTKTKPIEKPKPKVAQSNAASFHVNSQTNNIANEGDVPLTPAQKAAAAANLESVVQSDSSEKPYVDMFWMDAHESKQTGQIHLFGKIKVTNSQGADTYVSGCAIVKNHLRNLFVLPRVNKDGERTSMLEVHQELNSILKPKYIPNVQGASWGGKPVKRKYAFADSTVPKEETEYFKVVYDAKYPTPSEEECQGGKTYQRIFGTNASVLENFIIKRKLMGPCWIRLYNPAPSHLSLSWCKIELQVENPKDVKRLDLVDSSVHMPPPPVTSVSIKFKTVVNPSTHKVEIISLSAICHKETLLDTASDESTRLMTQLSLIRPLGNSISDDANIPQQFPHDFDMVRKQTMPQLQRMHNERALLSRFFAQLGIWDPDVLVGHHALGYDLEVILSRCIDLKVGMWSKIGRRKNMKIPHKNTLKNDWAIAEALTGRILCDTYLSSKDLVRETTYSLTNLAATQLKVQRVEVENEDVPLWFQNAQDIVKLAQHTLHDAQLVQRLMFKLQILPLTKQLTCIAGNLWSKTIKGNRADRNEYLLLHEFHQLKYIVPEKRKGKAEKGAKFSGGLVLEPKKGLYDSFILLLDFNSLYPSIIQEYNLCFTTVEWSNHLLQMKEKAEDQNGNESTELAPLPDESTNRGILPRVIKSLVDRRKAVKKMVKQEKNEDLLKEVSFITRFILKYVSNNLNIISFCI